MRDVIRWSGRGFAARILVLLGTTITWTIASLQLVLFDPVFYRPVSLSDFFAVYAYTTAWLFLAGAVLVFRELAPADRVVRTIALVVAAAAGVTGVANFLEDAMRLGFFGTVYVVAVLVASFGLLLLAAAAWRTLRPTALVPAIAALGAFSVVAGGGVLAVAWLWLAVTLMRARRAAPPMTEATTT